jgi:hypothetical protein
MQLVEQHILTRNDSRFDAVDGAAFAAKNLYNAATYIIRKAIPNAFGNGKVGVVVHPVGTAPAH